MVGQGTGAGAETSLDLHNSNIAANVVFQDESKFETELGPAGGGIFVSSGNMSVTNCSVVSNSAWRGGGIVVGGGAATICVTLMTNNKARALPIPQIPEAGDNLFVVSLAQVTYALPTPSGYYLEGAVLCREQLCCPSTVCSGGCGPGNRAPCDTPPAPCPQQLCTSDLYGSYVVVIGNNPDNQGFDDEFPTPCPPRFLGSSKPEDQRSQICAGVCPDGHHCPDNVRQPAPRTPLHQFTIAAPTCCAGNAHA